MFASDLVAQYSLTEARSALAAVEQRGGMSVEERVYNALQRLARV